MSLKQRIEDDLKTALKARDKERLACLRMIKSKLQEKHVAQRAKRGADATLSEEEVTAVVSAYAKQRRDSIESYEQGGREDLASKERSELEIVASYLPQQLDEAEVAAIVAAAVSESGATAPKDMGAVMKLVMPKVKGRADGKLVNRLVQAQLKG